MGFEIACRFRMCVDFLCNDAKRGVEDIVEMQELKLGYGGIRVGFG